MTVPRRYRGACLLGLSAAALTACSSPTASSWCGSDAPDAEVVFSSGTGVWGQDELAPELDELWRAGGLREGENLAFPLRASASTQGQLAIADFRLGEVVVVGADGAWQGAWGVRGEGPGELSTPVAANWDRRTGALAVFDFGRAKVVFLKNGQVYREDVAVAPAPLAPILASGEMLWAGVQPSGGVLLEPVPAEDKELSGQHRAALLHLKPGADEEDTLAASWTRTVGGEPPYAALPAPGWPRLVSAVGTDGHVALGGLDARYQVSLLDQNGVPVRVICRASSPLPLESRELRAPTDGAGAIEREDALRSAPRPDSLAPYGRLFLGARGRLWIQRERPAPLRYLEHLLGVPGATYDVFDESGRYLGQVRAPERARLQAAAGDTVWAYEIGDLDETWVVAYRLRFRPKDRDEIDSESR